LWTLTAKSHGPHAACRFPRQCFTRNCHPLVQDNRDDHCVMVATLAINNVIAREPELDADYRRDPVPPRLQGSDRWTAPSLLSAFGRPPLESLTKKISASRESIFQVMRFSLSH